MLCFMPQSMATIVGLSPPSLYVLIVFVETSATRFRKFGSTNPTSAGGDGGAPSTSSRPRIEPRSRKPLVSARVSTPVSERHRRDTTAFLSRDA